MIAEDINKLSEDLERQELEVSLEVFYNLCI